MKKSVKYIVLVLIVGLLFYNSVYIESLDKFKESKVNKVYDQFTSYLKQTLSLTTKRYYTEIGLLYGPGLGLILGTILQSYFDWPMSITFGLITGTALGFVIGYELDSQVKANGQMI